MRAGSMPHSPARAHRAHRAPDIFGGVPDGVGRAGLAEQPVFQSEGRDPEAGEILRGLDAFGIEHQFAMAATGRDDDGRAARLARRRQEQRERGIVDVLVPPILVLLGLVAA